MKIYRLIQEYLDDAKTKEHRYIKKIFLPNQYYHNPDVARIRKDMNVDIFRNNKIYLTISICPGGTIWVLEWHEELDEPSVVDSLDPSDYKDYTEMIDTIIRRNQIATWIDLAPMREELCSIYMIYIMGECNVF